MVLCYTKRKKEARQVLRSTVSREGLVGYGTVNYVPYLRAIENDFSSMYVMEYLCMPMYNSKSRIWEIGTRI